jgi:hypothetical protein
VYFGPPDELLGATEENPDGYWENIRFLDLNNQLLAQLHGGWDCPPDVSVDWEKHPGLDCLRRQAAALISCFARERAWGWKDPRNSLTAAFWRSLLPEAKFVLCLRNPVEVARSLHKRNYLSNAASWKLWLEHYRSLLGSVLSDSRITTHYDSWFWDAQSELRRIAAFIGCPQSCDLDEKVRLIVDPGLRHSYTSLADLKNAGAPPQVIDMYLQLCETAGPVYEAAKDRISSTLGVRKQWDVTVKATPPANSHTAQVFWPTADGYKEEASRIVGVPTTQSLEIDIPIPASVDLLHGPIRIDPFDAPALIDIKTIAVRSGLSNDVWSSNTSGWDTIRLCGTARRMPAGHGMLVLSYGDDPQLYLPGLPTPIPRDDLRLQIHLRIDQNMRPLAEHLDRLEQAARMQDQEAPTILRGPDHDPAHGRHRPCPDISEGAPARRIGRSMSRGCQPSEDERS